MRGRFRPAILLSAGYRNAGWGTAGVRRADRYNRVAALIGAAVKVPRGTHRARRFGDVEHHRSRRLLQSRDIAQADATR